MKKVLLSSIIFLSFLVKGNAQCCNTLHSSSISDSWLSCEKRVNPASLDTTHWIMYNFRTIKSLHKTVIWNLSHPEWENNGITEILIYHSTDSIDWQQVGSSALTVPLVNSTENNIGYEVIDFGGFQAQFLVIEIPTPNQCTGFGEIKIFTEPYFEPTQVSISENVICENGGIVYEIAAQNNLNGIFSGLGVLYSYENKFSFDPSLVSPGTYTLTYSYASPINNQLYSLPVSIAVLPCTTAICQPCQPCGDVPDFIFNANPIPNGIYNEKEIVSAGKVSENFDVKYEAENFVLLKNNFNSESNTLFLAEIQPCDSLAIVDNNIIFNGGFEQGTNFWSSSSPNYNLAIDTSEVYNDNFSGSFNTPINFGQSNLSLQTNTDYTLKLAVKSNSNQNIPLSVVFSDAQIGQNTVLKNAELEIKNFWQEYVLYFSTTNATTLGTINIFTNDNSWAKINLDEIELIEVVE